MFFLKNYGYVFMIVAIFSELVVPVIFAQIYPNYDQGKMLISEFGEVGSPVQKYFKVWQLVDGLLFILAAPSFYTYFYSTSPMMASWLGITIVLFGIGDCIFTAIFDRVETSTFSIQGALHDYGSGVGFVALLVNTFLLIMLYARQQQFLMVKIVSVIFALSSICMLFFASPRIPLVRKIDVHYRGFWQRLNLFFLYLPLLIIAVKCAFE